LKIVTQSAKGEAAYLYQTGAHKQRIDKPSAQSILGAIRKAMREIPTTKARTPTTKDCQNAVRKLLPTIKGGSVLCRLQDFHGRLG